MSTDEPAIYSKRVELYDRIYHWKDYEGEASRIRAWLQDLGVDDGARVVEAACGTGNYLEHLRRWYTVSGFDLNEGSVGHASKKLPGAEIVVADMVDYLLPQPADALLCLFSSIGYVFPDERLRATAVAFYHNVCPGGVVLLEPWLRPKVGLPGHFSQQTYEGQDMKLCRAGVHQVEGRLSVFDFHWLVTRAEGVEHFVEQHKLWMYTEEELVDAFTAAGFDAQWSEDGLMRDRGLLIAVRP